MTEAITLIKCYNCKEEYKVYIFAKTKKRCQICDKHLYKLTGGKIKYHRNIE